ncbi:MAG: transketolase [Candidatus Liptonbacteria bacterium]|nr:transketolase [Candidatus Liptonbacteria bacterium]
MNHLKEKILRAATAAQEGHIPAAYSILDIVWVLYDRILGVTPENANDPDRNRFILSKGHAAVGLYVVLAEKGFISSDLLKDFGKFESPLGGHPDRLKVPGVEASTGSLGHGFPMAVGLALGAKIKKKPSRVYVIVGDGEANEGTIWESAMLAAHHKLDNLYCILDHNHSGDGAMGPGNMRKKFESFGWHASSIDGHDQKAIHAALTQRVLGKPVAVIAETVKGKGIKIMENSPEWTHKYPAPEQLETMAQELRAIKDHA